MNQNNDIDKSKPEGAEIDLLRSSPFFAKLDNFWYHHKWKVIIITFFAVVLIVSLVQIVGKTEPDVTAVIAVPENLTPLQSKEISTALVSLMPSDINGDGEKEVTVISYAIYSEDEFTEANENETETDEKGNSRYVIKVDRAYNVSQFEDYTEYLKTGEASILFVSEYLYSNLVSQERVRPLADIFGEELPKSALSDGCGIRLGDIGAYSFLEPLQALPEDTVVCLLRPYIWGASSDSEKYSEIEEYFKKLVTFAE